MSHDPQLIRRLKIKNKQKSKEIYRPSTTPNQQHASNKENKNSVKIEEGKKNTEKKKKKKDVERHKFFVLI